MLSTNIILDEGEGSFGGNNYCGDGVVRSTEECDDGNGINGDGCDHNCEIELSKELPDLTPRDLLFRSFEICYC